MTVAAVLEHRNPFTDEQVDAIRDCLDQIDDDERLRLWALLEPCVRAIGAGGAGALWDVVPGIAPDGPIRRCLERIAAPYVTQYRSRATPARNAGVGVRGRAQPAFLGMFSGMSGTVAPVETWASRGFFWEKVDADAFAGIDTSRSWHEPRPLDYRHDPSLAVGCSRAWTLDDDGNLSGRFELGAHPLAQHAARAAQSGELGLSMSVRFETRWLAHPAPDEWNPDAGILDVAVHDHATVEAVALTPTPTYPSATVERVW